MKRECPFCGKEITYLEVSKEIDGTVEIPDENKAVADFMNVFSEADKPAFRAFSVPQIKWELELGEVKMYFCPKCLQVIDDETLRDWGLK